MNELIVFLTLVFVAYIFMSSGVMSRMVSNKLEKNGIATPSEVKPKIVVPEDSVLRRHFLTHLRTEVEAEIILHSIDPNLRHYYDASVAAEIQKRLAG
ncbi:MAG: hypothetical protein WC856_22470 [Methylococcaceae bacterium]|jgi:hypothetical protein